MIMTVRGPIDDVKLGKTLTHEHIIVDFRGAEFYGHKDYELKDVIEVVKPYLKEIKNYGYTGFVECTPQYFGRDIMVLKSLAEELDIHIIASTGCFAAGNDKHIPKIYYEKTEKEIAEMWIREWKEGIEASNVKPGIIKIAVDSGPLSSIDKKIVSSACITSLETGLTIACHTGEKECALEVFTVIKKYKLNPSKLILVHADNIEDREVIFSLAEKGCFIEFDWIGLKDINNHVELILESISRGYISQILLSQDAGQYYVGFKDGNRKKFRPYSYIDKYLIPELKKKIDDKDIYIMQVMNPRRALAIE